MYADFQQMLHYQSSTNEMTIVYSAKQDYEENHFVFSYKHGKLLTEMKVLTWIMMLKI